VTGDCGRTSPLALSRSRCRTGQAPGIAIYHVSVDAYVVMAAGYDLAGSLRDLVTAVMALGGAVARSRPGTAAAVTLRPCEAAWV
jgi:hypothetical protein